LPLPDGGWIAVAGADLVKLDSDGRRSAVAVEPGRELVAAGNIVIPPYGTNQRKYYGVLGSHRINLGNGYALHGTNQPESIGRSVSHGCIRLRNEDISELYAKVSIGTPIFIY
jgi:lipoprotein-anchoring transpeptidase ErfK/SrfK